MANAGLGALLRVWALALLALGIWALTKYCDRLPTPLGSNAPKTEFSAGRAEEVLARLLGPQIPHPASSAENAAVRARILAEYAKMGISATTQRALGCNLSKRFGALSCGTVTNVIAQVKPGNGKALVLLAHYDSVPAGPGASDDESGDATIFETVRALAARGMKSDHPIIALHTDGEEFGLLGANAFLDDPANRARVGAVINVEARGNQGQSLLFQTSPGDAPLIDLYAKSVPKYATSSLFAVIYKLLPNDTDLTVFLNHDLPGYNFAFSDNVAHYHTALDRRENLDPGTLQMHGDNMLGMAATLARTDFSVLKGGGDAIYLTVLGHFLPRMPASWALPLAVLVVALLAACFWVGSAAPTDWRGWIAAFAIVPVLVIGSAVAGWVLFVVAQIVSGNHPDPTYAYPLPMRIALAFGAWAAALVVTAFAETRAAALGVWLFFGAVALITAAMLPGLSPYYLFPSLIAAPLLLAQAFLPRAWSGPAAQLLLLLASIPALILWIGLAGNAEQIGGLAYHPLITVPLGTAVATLVPVLAAQRLSHAARFGSAAVAFAVALGFAIWGGMVPTYSEWKPQRLNISYVENDLDHRALWAATARPLGLPASLRAVANFSAQPAVIDPTSYFMANAAPAGAPHIAPPTADVRVAKAALGLRRVTLALHGGSANQMVLIVPQAAWMKAIEIGGKRFDVPGEWEALPREAVACSTDDCAYKEITLELGAKKPVNIVLIAQHYGIPPEGAKFQAARPKTAVVSQTGDTTVLISQVKIPGP